MIKSMTGYGRCEEIVNSRKITAEIRSVNHRYCDYTIKVPKNYGFLEDAVKENIAGAVSRGKVEVYIGIDSYLSDDKTVTLNEELANNYIDVLSTLKSKFSLNGDIDLSMVTRFPDIFKSEVKTENQDELLSDVLVVLKGAVKDFVSMRQREGERILADFTMRLGLIFKLVEGIEIRSPQCIVEYRAKLLERIKEALENTVIDEGRILTEAAIFADKTAVAEETVRLKSHICEFNNILSAANGTETAVGRKLDFLIQEFNREANTIGSKCNDIEISKLVVELKSEIEKIREQVQNIE